MCCFACCKGGWSVSGLSVKYSEPDEERHELHLMITEETSATQASEWLTALHKVKHSFTQGKTQLLPRRLIKLFQTVPAVCLLTCN